MKPQERIEEAHGLWELAIVRLAAIAAVISAHKGTSAITAKLLSEAVESEQLALAQWRSVSGTAIADSEGRP